MSLAAIVSSSPCLDFEGQPDIEPMRTWYDDLHGTEGWRSWWIVPTSRRRRQIIRAKTSSARLPRVLVLDGLIKHLEGFARIQRPSIGNTGQLLRIARAWNEVHPNGSLSVGRVLQLQRIASEWRESGDPPPAPHPHAKFLRAYDRIIRNDQCLDRPAAIDALAKEIANANSPLAGLLRGKRILFDGFHRFSDRELALIEAIGQHAEVRLWLVGDAGQPYHANVASVLKRLGISAHHDQRKPVSPSLSAFGRSLFVEGATSAAPIECIAAPNIETECHAVAVRIKSLMRDWNNARLADIAVVIPDDAYLPLLKATFHAARIDYSPGAEVFALPESRPARVLLLALRLIRHGWQAETLFDFLRQPLIFRRLKKSHLLEWLRQRSSLGVARNDWKSWKAKWKELYQNHAQAIVVDDEQRDEPPEERRQRAERLAEELAQLVDSIDKVLAPIEKLEKELGKSSTNEPAELVAAIARLLEAIHASIWLSPKEHPQWTLIPEREWEIDQLAFNNLKDVLVELHETPIEDMPPGVDRRVDVELVLKLALAAETFQTSAEDDAGVQILRPRTIRGSRFRAIIAMGMVEGKVPRDVPDTRSNAEVDSPIKRLREEEQHEQEYLFAQIFESASERVILTRPLKDNDAPLMESPFLRRIRESLGDKAHVVPPTIIDLRQALLLTGRDELENENEAQRMLAVRNTWNKRQKDNELRIEDWALPLLALRYPMDRPFSATALEKYASCPFNHFAAKTLGLDELERDDAAMRWGSFLHDVLERFFKENSQSAAESVRDRFLKLLRKRWPDVAHTLDPHYMHDFEMALTDAFVTVNAFLSDNGFQQKEAEWERKTVAIPDGNGGSLLLHVKIDRIDCHSNGEMELICDFKTGGISSGAKLRDRLLTGRALQLPLYGYARQLETKVPVKHGLYVKLSRKVSATSPDKHGPFLVSVGDALKTGARTAIPFVPEEAGRIAVELAGKMRAGLIPLSIFDADHKDPACQAYCTARHACRHPKGYKV